VGDVVTQFSRGSPGLALEGRRINITQAMHKDASQFFSSQGCHSRIKGVTVMVNKGESIRVNHYHLLKQNDRTDTAFDKKKRLRKGQTPRSFPPSDHSDKWSL
jgi:hypothetical protein